MNWFFGGLCNWRYWNGRFNNLRFNNLRFCIGRLISLLISGTGGSLVSDSSRGFTGSQGSGGAVFNTGWGRLLITIISSSSSWGSVGTLLCLTLGGIKSVCTMGLVSRHGCYLPVTWSHQGLIHSLAGCISMGWSNCINSSCRSWRLLNFVQGGIPSILYLVSASRMTA